MSRQPTTALPIPSRAQTETPEAELFYSSSLPKDSGSGSLSQRDGAALLDGFAAMRRASIVMTGEGAVAAHKGRARLVVQKFGGTSVGTAERLAMVASIVKNTLNPSSGLPDRPIVVLSAMSSHLKSAGTTSRLLLAAESVLSGSDAYVEIVSQIEQDHRKAAWEALGGIGEPDSSKGTDPHAQLRSQCLDAISEECGKLKSFLDACSTIEEISPRSRDMVISVGEKLSALIFSAVLKSHGIPSAYVNLERLVDRHFAENEVGQAFYDYLASRLGEVLSAVCWDDAAVDKAVGSGRTRGVEGWVVPVVTGYLGPIPGSIITTIGRGYTDLTAALCSVALSAAELQIWKEVDGIFTADPRKAPLARLLPYITPDEAAELTYYGSEVIHPFTMEQVIRASIPIRIKNTFNPAGKGTVVAPPEHRDGDSEEEPAAKEVEQSGAAQPYFARLSGHATAVTIKSPVTVLNVHSNRKSVSHGFLAHIFRVLDRFVIVVDLISTSEVHVSMALGPNVNERSLELALGELRKTGTVDVLPNMAILSLVGEGMKNAVGISGRMFLALGAVGVNIEMISQGASEINISCVIERNMANEALQAVHDTCVLGMPLKTREA